MGFAPIGNPHLGEHLVGRQIGHHVGQRPFGEGDVARTVRTDHSEHRLIGRRDRWQFRRRIEMAQAAANGAPVAGLEMTDKRERFLQDRRPRRDDLRAGKIALSGHGADGQRLTGVGDAVHVGNAIEVDHMVGHDETHIQHRHQRLAAGQ